MGGERDNFLSGEIGILKEASLTSQPESIAKLYLLIEFDKRLYIGVSLIADAAFARNIYELLKRHLDESIASIGDLDVAYLL